MEYLLKLALILARPARVFVKTVKKKKKKVPSKVFAQAKIIKLSIKRKRSET
jgi:hypothetical protein